MKKPSFFIWYYSKGLEELLEIWGSFLRFFLHYFSIKKLFTTLFSPWKRDVVLRDWRGWRPLKSLEILTENVFSRLIGSIVRSVVILTGLVCVILTLLAGLGLLFFWIAFPFIFLILLSRGMLGSLSFLIGAVAMFFVFFVFLSWAFRNSTQDCYSISTKGFSKQAWFKRLMNRLGKADGKINEKIFGNEKILKKFIDPLGLTAEDFEKISDWEIKFQQEKEKKKKFWLWENLRKKLPIGKDWHYAYTINLDRHSTDLSRYDYTEYKDVELFGHRDEQEVIKLILERPSQNNILLAGLPGTGKSAILHSIAKMIRERQIGKHFQDKRILFLNLGEALSSASGRGQDLENFLHRLFSEAAYAGNIILVIEGIENYLGERENILHVNISPIIIEYLKLAGFQVIATSTLKDYHRLIENHGELIKYFEVVEIKEPSEEDALKILLQNLEKYEKKRVIFTYQALKEIIKSSSRYNWEFPLPERAIDLAMDVLVYWQKKGNQRFITPETVAEFLTLKTGVQMGEIKGEEKRKLLNLEKILHERIIGQEEAVCQVAEALRKARSGIGDSKKPIGSFLFLGPTGVGKTETAKALAESYFDNETKMIRLDMSEFQMPSAIDRLIGSSQLNQPGRLASQIKSNPFSLLLLDEIEKAYPDILDLFLQILDEGCFTDAFGEKINCRNLIIIATSNAGAPLIKKMVEEKAQYGEIKRKIIDFTVDSGIFRLEFLNRFNGVIFFRPLNSLELQSVVKLILKKLAKRLKDEKNIEVNFGEELIDEIISSGYESIFGARSINRYVEDKIEDLIAKEIISGEVKKGEKITISL